MNYKDLIQLYEFEKKRHGSDAYKKISEILREAKIKHKQVYLDSKSAQKARDEGRTPDHEQSWRAFKGKNLEKLLLHMIQDCIEDIGLEIIEGSKLGANKLPIVLNKVKRNLLINYGEYGYHLPDADLVIFEPKLFNVIAIISSKVTLRERIAQTGYWKLKLSNDTVTKNIKVLFMTLDEDSTLTKKFHAKKGRAIAEIDTDGTYVLTTDNLEESTVVKLFNKFIFDMKKFNKNYKRES